IRTGIRAPSSERYHFASWTQIILTSPTVTPPPDQTRLVQCSISILYSRRWGRARVGLGRRDTRKKPGGPCQPRPVYRLVQFYPFTFHLAAVRRGRSFMAAVKPHRAPCDFPKLLDIPNPTVILGSSHGRRVKSPRCEISWGKANQGEHLTRHHYYSSETARLALRGSWFRKSVGEK
ncbi:hypothetical protein XELAEV_18021757mg, partial [Xenopus laevis]